MPPPRKRSPSPRMHSNAGASGPVNASRGGSVSSSGGVATLAAVEAPVEQMEVFEGAVLGVLGTYGESWGEPRRSPPTLVCACACTRGHSPSRTQAL